MKFTRLSLAVIVLAWMVPASAQLPVAPPLDETELPALVGLVESSVVSIISKP